MTKEQANRLANVLSGLGIGKGDVVALVKTASLETAVAYGDLPNGLGSASVSSLFGPGALSFRLRPATPRP